LPDSTDGSLKRRNSSVSETDSKRRRLSSENLQPLSPRDSQQSPPYSNAPLKDSRPKRRIQGAVEERKRGQRLFGALLGTLSQSLSPAAQKRRADIERKQQNKLKLQDEEYGEKKRKRKEDLITQRNAQQEDFERQALRARHSNLKAMARFLKTKTEPVLYYKPWQLREVDEDTIDRQIRETEDLIEKEENELSERHHSQHTSIEQSQDQAIAGAESETLKAKTASDSYSTNDSATLDSTEKYETTREAKFKTDTTPTNPRNDSLNSQPEAARGQDDDGGEVMEEDKEDTVIY